MSTPERIGNLIVRHLRGALTPGEIRELQEWVNSSAENKALFDELTQEERRDKMLQEFSEGKKQAWDKISQHIKGDMDALDRSNKRRRAFAFAAAILVLAAASGFLWINYKQPPIIAEQPQKQLPADSIMPANDRPVLTLANGKKIFLDDSLHGKLLFEQGADIIMKENGQLVYQPDATADHTDGLSSKNTVSTSRGRQYQLVLSDGTKVWLNAASSITYPVVFTGTERKVSITGEVYFEVATSFSPFRGPGGKGGDRKIPFIVNIAGKGQVEVLGTHFNINAYDDEASIRTTLLEGSVRYITSSSSLLLKSGQQALQTNAGLTVAKDINTEEVVSWKNGLFVFKNTTIETILRQAGRWYDLDIIYKGGITDRFTGTIARNVSLSKFLQILEYSEVKFTLEGKQLTIK